jgi:hypothetical protein
MIDFIELSKAGGSVAGALAASIQGLQWVQRGKGNLSSRVRILEKQLIELSETVAVHEERMDREIKEQDRRHEENQNMMREIRDNQNKVLTILLSRNGR